MWLTVTAESVFPASIVVAVGVALASTAGLAARESPAAAAASSPSVAVSAAAKPVAMRWSEDDVLIDYALDPTGESVYALLDSQPLAVGRLTVFILVKGLSIAMALGALGLVLSLWGLGRRRIGRLLRCGRCERVFEDEEEIPDRCPGCGRALGPGRVVRGRRDRPALRRRAALAGVLLVLAGLGAAMQVQHVAWADRLWPRPSAAWGDATADRPWFDAFRIPARRVVALDIETGRIARTLLIDPAVDDLQRLAVTADATALFAAGPGGIYRLGLGTAAGVTPWQYHPGITGADLLNLAACPRGRRLAKALGDGRVFLWEHDGPRFHITELRPPAELELEYGRDILALDSEHLVLIADGYEIAVWRFPDLARAALVLGAPDPDIAMLMAARRPWAAARLEGRHYAGLWSYSWLEAARHRPTHPPRHPATDRAEAIVLWDLAEGEAVAELRAPPRTLLGAFALSVDARHVAAALDRGPDAPTRAVAVYHSARRAWGEPVAVDLAHIMDVRLSADGQTVLVAGRQQRELPPQELVIVHPPPPAAARLD